MKSDVYDSLQKYLGRLGREVTADPFLCSWTREPYPVRLGQREETLPSSNRVRSCAASEAIYLTQRVHVGSTPQLVFYNRGSNVNIIVGEVVENEELEIIYSQAGRVRVAWGHQVSTEYGT